VTVDWQTVANTATTADFVNASGTLTIAANAPGGTIAIEILADKTTEPVETFTVELTRATGATIADGAGTVSIRPATTGLALGDVVVTEPDAGTFSVGVAATLGASTNRDVTFAWQLRSGTGTVDQDAPPASGTSTIKRGALGTIVRVAISGDTTVEPDETLELNVTSVTNASLGDGLGTITLRNTDVAPPDPFGWQPPTGAIPASGTIVYVESSPGDYIGGGRTYTYTKANSVITVGTTANRANLSIRGDEDWDATFAEPSSNQQVTTGYWENLGRYPFNVPGLSFTGEGRGCNTLLGRFIVDQISFTGSTLSTLTLRFEQKCEVSGQPLRGFLRYDAADPTTPPPPGDPAGLAWRPPAGVLPATGNYLYFESPTGDYIGQGRTELYTDANATFKPAWGGRLVQVFVNAPGGWNATFSGPDQMTQLTVGLYQDVQRYPFHNPVKGGMDFSGEGRGCNQLLATYAVDQIAWDTNGLVSVTIRFTQRCEVTGPPLNGAVHWERSASG
jgi:hypothetical protein